MPGSSGERRLAVAVGRATRHTVPKTALGSATYLTLHLSRRGHTQLWHHV